MGLASDSVLIGLDGVGGVKDGGSMVFWIAVYRVEERDKRGVVGVDGGDDGEVVLEFVEMVGRSGGNGDGVVERVEERGVIWAKGHFADDVGEVES